MLCMKPVALDQVTLLLTSIVTELGLQLDAITAATDESTADAGKPTTSSAASTPAAKAGSQSRMRPTLGDLVYVADVFEVVRLRAGRALEPCVENLGEYGLARPSQREREH